MVFKGLGSIDSWENDQYRIAFGVPNECSTCQRLIVFRMREKYPLVINLKL
jgi:hypothetical protein